ncbi:cytosine permease [Pseudoclavibacter chungangensis]|uniref:Cytosine permease n=1 Tax=Pseudoclavibacter chungangensis TaxID=587635 RepID=A0A7J5BS90_9MICO|nr:cytosine permease [Pseudoclavibacter chungangensis]KAB1655675.1 cytosine permease [Pseudoclavibacter chungangensis]NYJ67914.1 NCS1 family nucleobase:cation symporter-1 [Pseudoclavibacter chungangensis]
MNVPVAQVPRIEDKTIQPIPLNERHGKARDLFTIWFGSNIMVLTVVTGALSSTVFGLDVVTGVIALLVGNLLGGVFMALHSAQGPKLGVPQMVQTRGQFGSFGALLVVAVVVIMYIGFFAANLVLGGQAVNVVAPVVPVDWGIVLVGIVSVAAAAFGYRLIHAYTRIMSIVSGIALAVAFITIIAAGLPANLLSTGSFNLAGFMGAVSVAALWQIAYAPYVSDYSRYLPEDTGPRTAFWVSYAGCILGSYLPMVLGTLVGGILVALGQSGDDIVGGLGQLLGPMAVPIIAVFSIGVAGTNSMNLYCGVLSVLTIGQTFVPSWNPRAITRAVVAAIIFGLSLVLALVGRDDFLAHYSNFLALLLYVLVPWTAINLVDYYLLHKGDYRVDDFFRRDGGVYGRFNWIAIACYLLGAVIQVPFMVTTLYEGPIGAALGIDISWIVGLAVISPLYFVLARAFSRRGRGTTDLTPAQPVTTA